MVVLSIFRRQFWGPLWFHCMERIPRNSATELLNWNMGVFLFCWPVVYLFTRRSGEKRDHGPTKHIARNWLETWDVHLNRWPLQCLLPAGRTICRLMMHYVTSNEVKRSRLGTCRNNLNVFEERLQTHHNGVKTLPSSVPFFPQENFGTSRLAPKSWPHWNHLESPSNRWPRSTSPARVIFRHVDMEVNGVSFRDLSSCDRWYQKWAWKPDQMMFIFPWMFVYIFARSVLILVIKVCIFYYYTYYYIYKWNTVKWQATGCTAIKRCSEKKLVAEKLGPKESRMSSRWMQINHVNGPSPTITDHHRPSLTITQSSHLPPPPKRLIRDATYPKCHELDVSICSCRRLSELSATSECHTSCSIRW